MKHALLLFGLLAWAMPLMAEIAVGVPSYGEAPGYQLFPSVASDGDGYFAVWMDQRSGVQSVVGTRLNDAGEALDPMGILLETAHRGYPPVVVWSGSSYVLVWQEPDSTRTVIKVLRVRRDGHVDGPPRVIAVGTASSVASNGARVVVVYEGTGIRAAVLDGDANVLADFALAGTDAQRFGPFVAASRDEFVVAWHRGRGPLTIEAARLTAGGALIGSTPREIGVGTLAELASDGRDFNFIAYKNPGLLVSRKVSADLASSFPEYALGTSLTHPVMVWTGTRYAALAAGLRDFLRFSIDGNGQPSPAAAERKILDSESSASYDGATNGRTLLTIWSARTADQSSLAMFASIDGAPAQLVALSANEQLGPTIVKGNGVDLVVWREERGIYATRIDATGRSLDGRGMLVARGDGSNYPYLLPPAVAFDGKQFVVAYRDTPALFTTGSGVVRFLSPADGLLPDTLQLGTMTESPILIRAGEETFAAWVNGTTLRAAKINATGALVGSPVTVAENGELGEKIAALHGAWNGTELLLTWGDRFEGVHCMCGPVKPLFKRIRMARVNANLTLLDTQPRLISDMSGPGEVETAVASDGNEWLAVWRFENELRARRIARDGTPQGAADGVVIGSGAMKPALLWDGVRYALVWKVLPGGDGPRAVRYAYLPRTGALTLSAPVTVIPTYNDDSPSLAPVSSGVFALAYTRVSSEHGGVSRAFVRDVGTAVRRRAVR